MLLIQGDNSPSPRIQCSYSEMMLLIQGGDAPNPCPNQVLLDNKNSWHNLFQVLVPKSVAPKLGLFIICDHNLNSNPRGQCS